MALPRKKSRSIVVGGEEFLYLVSGAFEDWGMKKVVVQHKDSNGAKLLWEFLCGENQEVAPRHVALIIKCGKVRGWRYLEKGGDFRIEVSGEFVFS